MKRIAAPVSDHRRQHGRHAYAAWDGFAPQFDSRSQAVRLEHIAAHFVAWPVRAGPQRRHEIERRVSVEREIGDEFADAERVPCAQGGEAVFNDFGSVGRFADDQDAVERTDVAIPARQQT